jgi:hypothetical protein
MAAKKKQAQAPAQPQQQHQVVQANSSFNLNSFLGARGDGLGIEYDASDDDEFHRDQDDSGFSSDSELFSTNSSLCGSMELLDSAAANASTDVFALAMQSQRVADVSDLMSSTEFNIGALESQAALPLASIEITAAEHFDLFEAKRDAVAMQDGNEADGASDQDDLLGMVRAMCEAADTSSEAHRAAFEAADAAAVDFLLSSPVPVRTSASIAASTALTNQKRRQAYARSTVKTTDLAAISPLRAQRRVVASVKQDQQMATKLENKSHKLEARAAARAQLKAHVQATYTSARPKRQTSAIARFKPF